MVPSLTDCYHRLGFQVTESEDGLRIGFKPGMAHAIVKEIWNEQPLTRSFSAAPRIAILVWLAFTLHLVGI